MLLLLLFSITCSSDLKGLKKNNNPLYFPYNLIFIEPFLSRAHWLVHTYAWYGKVRQVWGNCCQQFTRLYLFGFQDNLLPQAISVLMMHSF